MNYLLYRPARPIIDSHGKDWLKTRLFAVWLSADMISHKLF